MTDSAGAAFASDGHYELQFTGQDLPPVDAFWSLTMYKADMNLVPNPATRYSIGDRTPDVTRDADGGMTIYIQNEPPDDARRSNWLPCPDGGTWFVILRMYQPHEEVLTATWKCPGIRKVG